MEKCKIDGQLSEPKNQYYCFHRGRQSYERMYYGKQIYQGFVQVLHKLFILCRVMPMELRRSKYIATVKKEIMNQCDRKQTEEYKKIVFPLKYGSRLLVSGCH